MALKSDASTYTTDWSKLKGWAAAQKIPTAAVNNVQALDATRVQSGYYPMSNSERTRAMLAAAGMNYNTALPTDNPQASNIIGNTISNVRGIATGLMPTRLVSNIFDTLKNSVEDVTSPGHLAKEGGIAGALTNTVLSWIPGAYDVGTFLKAGGGMKGLDALATQPVTSILDVMPALKWLDSSAGAVAASTSAGTALADRLGIGSKALGQMGSVRMAGKAIGSIEVGKGVAEQLDQRSGALGQSVVKRKTIAQRASDAALSHGIGRTISNAAHGLMSIGNRYSIEYRNITRNMTKAIGALSKDTFDRTGALAKEGELSQFNRLMHSGATADQLMADPSIPISIKWAVKQYQPWEQWHEEYMLKTGKALTVKIPGYTTEDGTVVPETTDIYESTAPVHALVQAADEATAKAEEASAISDQITDQAARLDTAWAPAQDRIEAIKTQIQGIPAIMERQGNPMNGLALRTWGELTGKGGLIDQMTAALQAKDWAAFQKAANAAERKMATKMVQGGKGETRPSRVAGRPVTLVRDSIKYGSRLPKNHVRFFRPDGPGEAWSTDFGKAQQAAGPGGKVYKVDVAEADAQRFFHIGEFDAVSKAQRAHAAAGAPHRNGYLGPIERGVTKATQPGWDSVPVLAELRQLIHSAKADYGQMRTKLWKEYQKQFEGVHKTSEKKSARYLNKQAADAQQKVIDWARKNPPANYRDAVLRAFFKHFLASDKAEILLDAGASYLKEKGYDKAIVDRIRTNPQRLYELVAAVADPTFRDPFLPAMTKEDHELFMNDALHEVEILRSRGEKPMYVPTVGGDFAGSPYLADDRIYVNPTKYPTISASYKKAMDMSSTVNDVMLGVAKTTKELLGKDATLEFVNSVLKPMLRTKTSLYNAVAKHKLGQIETDISATPVAVVDSVIRTELGLVKFNIRELLSKQDEKTGEFGLEHHDLGLDDAETYYIPAAMLEQVEKLVGRDQFPLHGTWDKATGVFKYSILGLSPRYTAHILFGGSMLMALRINPGSFAMIGDAARAVHAYHKGDEQTIVPPDVFQGASQRGSPDVEVHFRGGRNMGYIALQDWLAKRGFNPKVATAAQWAAGAADLNFRFTNYISDMQRALSYLDGAKAATRKGYFHDKVTGERISMTSDRAHWEGMQAAERVMGNLQAMTPLERSVARKIMPFYGWTKHILKYILTYPVDHPWRAMFLSVLATQNTDNFSKGLDERMQLLFFLGQPDTKGNVSAVDVRALDPFRDVANYATWGGWISSLNPILSAPFAAIDPQIIYGSNVLHPNITYDSVYGTNVAQGTGTAMGAAEAEIPELSVLDNALGLTAQARQIKKSGGEGKAIFQALNIPFAQVQHLNLQQISAKHEIDRYQQAKNDALNAWQTGDFSTLDKYPGTVPDPLNAGYNITPAALQKQYAAALKAYPSLPPSETVAPLPSPAL